jgi:hypothetical protein
MEEIPIPENNIEEILKLRDELLNIDSDEIQSEISDRTDSFRKYLQSEYPNYADYAAYHVLTWSSRYRDDGKIPDFPEGDSVKRFLEQLHSEYLT